MFCYACGGERKVQKLTNPHYQVDYFNEDLDHCWIPNHITRSMICPGSIPMLLNQPLEAPVTKSATKGTKEPILLKTLNQS